MPRPAKNLFIGRISETRTKLLVPFFLFAVFFLLPHATCAKGGMTSGDLGGSATSDQMATFHQPWFVGIAPVTYCIDRGEGFSVSLAEVESQTRDALADWNRTLAQLSPRPLDGKFRGSGTITTSFREVPCGESHELTFSLGVPSDETKEALRKEKFLPAALARVTSYDPATGRSKGFIWLSPDQGEKRFLGREGRTSLWEKMPENYWGQDASVYNAVLHELGHVFGFPHLAFTPMSEEAVQLLEPGAQPSKRLSTAALIATPADFPPLDRLCASAFNSSPHPYAGHLPDREGFDDKVCFGLDGRSWANAITEGMTIELSQAPEGTAVPIDRQWSKADYPSPDANWKTAASGRLFGLKPKPESPVKLSGLYETKTGKLEPHEFLRLRTEKAWEGRYRSGNGDLCPAELRVFNRHAFTLSLKCGKGEQITGYFPDSPLFQPAAKDGTNRN